MAVPEEKRRGWPKAERELRSRKDTAREAQSRVRLGVAQTMNKLYPLQS